MSKLEWLWTRRLISGYGVLFPQLSGFHIHFLLLVPRVYIIRARLPPLAVRESPNNATGRLDSHGGHERAVQAPPERVFPRFQKSDRCDVESNPHGPTQYPPTHRDDGPCLAVIVVIGGCRATPWGVGRLFFGLGGVQFELDFSLEIETGVFIYSYI